MFLEAFVIGQLLIVLAVVAFFYFNYHSEILLLSGRETNISLLGQKTLERYLSEVSRDVKILAHSGYLKEFLNSKSEDSLQKLQREFRNFSCYKALYDQIRFLDEHGTEIVRINYNNGDCETVAANKLQNKGSRYYFSDTFNLSSGAVFVSPLDLNIERGKIEQPLKPMIRVGAPVFDTAEGKRGIVLVNFLAAIMLDEFGAIMQGSEGYPALLNKNGYWLMNTQGGDQLEWGFMFQNNHRFDQSYPEVWQHMNVAPESQVRAKEGIFTWRTVYPLQLPELTTSTGAGEWSTPSKNIVPRDQYSWKVLTHLPLQTVDFWSQSRRDEFLLVASASIPLVLLFALILSYYRYAGASSLDALSKSEPRLKAITADLAEGLIILDLEGRLVSMNPEAQRLLLLDEEEEQGELLFYQIHPDLPGRDKKLKQLIDTIKAGKVLRVEDDSFVDRDGRDFPVSYTVSPYYIHNNMEGVVISFQDITERKLLQEQLVTLATRDELTGLYNRREIENLIQHSIKYSIRNRRILSVCMIDIDHFKRINDTYGHQTGDHFLRALGDLLAQQTRESDAAGRYGGEEFIVLLVDTDMNGALKWAEVCRSRVEALSVTSDKAGPSISTTVSIGIAQLDLKNASYDHLVSQADAALYHAKNNGRNQVCAE